MSGLPIYSCLTALYYLLTLKMLYFWKFTSYCSLKPLWSGMGEVVPARTSPTLHPPSPPTVHQLSRLALYSLIWSGRAQKLADSDDFLLARLNWQIPMHTRHWSKQMKYLIISSLYTCIYRLLCTLLSPASQAILFLSMSACLYVRLFFWVSYLSYSKTTE